MLILTMLMKPTTLASIVSCTHPNRLLCGLGWYSCPACPVHVCVHHVPGSLLVLACAVENFDVSSRNLDSIYSFSKQARRLLHLLKGAIQGSGNITVHWSPYELGLSLPTPDQDPLTAKDIPSAAAGVSLTDVLKSKVLMNRPNLIGRDLIV